MMSEPEAFLIWERKVLENDDPEGFARAWREQYEAQRHDVLRGEQIPQNPNWRFQQLSEQPVG